MQAALQPISFERDFSIADQSTFPGGRFVPKVTAVLQKSLQAKDEAIVRSDPFQIPPLSFRGAKRRGIQVFLARAENQVPRSICIFSLYLRASRYNCGPQPQGIVNKQFL